VLGAIGVSTISFWAEGNVCHCYFHPRRFLGFGNFEFGPSNNLHANAYGQIEENKTIKSIDRYVY
jgi:hypothetical protein